MKISINYPNGKMEVCLEQFFPNGVTKCRKLFKMMQQHSPEDDILQVKKWLFSQAKQEREKASGINLNEAYEHKSRYLQEALYCKCKYDGMKPREKGKAEWRKKWKHFERLGLSIVPDTEKEIKEHEATAAKYEKAAVILEEYIGENK